MRENNPRLSVFESGFVLASGDGAVSPRSSSAPVWVGGESETSWAGRMTGSSATRVTWISWILFAAGVAVRAPSGVEALLATKIGFVFGGVDEGPDLDPVAEADWLARGTPPTAAPAVVEFRAVTFAGMGARLVFATGAATRFVWAGCVAGGFNSTSS
jgi:hypothetical protein